MAEYTICRIRWMDANCLSGWHNADAIAERGLLLVQSVGWLVQESDDCLTLAMSHSPHRAGDLLTIPKVSIVYRWAQ
jgi:hypothetical protein